MDTNEIAVINRLKQLCSRSEKCRSEIIEKLQQWNFEGESEKIIDALIEEGYLDEKRFTDSFVNDKIRFGKWGRLKIKFMLNQKKIPSEIINSALTSFSNDDYLQVIETELIKKNKSLKGGNFFEKKRKLYAFAAQRGYESDFSLQIIDKILSH
jgi:regulatory protein